MLWPDKSTNILQLQDNHFLCIIFEKNEYLSWNGLQVTSRVYSPNTEIWNIGGQGEKPKGEFKYLTKLFNVNGTDRQTMLLHSQGSYAINKHLPED